MSLENRVIGVLGGGQLGRMLIQDASRLGISIAVLDPDAAAPAKQVLASAAHRHGSFHDAGEIAALAAKVDVLTVEIEHVNVEALADLERRCLNSGGRSDRGIKVRPSSGVLRIIQDKYIQHVHFRDASLPVAPFAAVVGDSAEAGIAQQVADFGLPIMVKSRRLAYDGRGNYVVRKVQDIAAALHALDGDASGAPTLYVEQMIPFICEIAVMVVKASSGRILSYPAVETVHRNSICHVVFAPLRTNVQECAQRAQDLAEKAVASLGEGAVGVFGVEMFLLSDGQLLINEVAPRPHNSGHYTIEACYTSQYDNHLRAILDLPLGSTEMRVPCAAMLNVLGISNSMGDLKPLLAETLATKGATLHMYGKRDSRADRKLGHITLVADSVVQLDTRLRQLLPLASSNDSVIPTSAKTPTVGIIMGSDSDLRVMRKAAEVLELFHVSFELNIVSAHRTPNLMLRYASTAASRGLSVVIAGAGGAAHLPGMVASLTTLPVIGVPVKASSLDGVDSLHSIVQMPRGVPVATVAIDNATNAALLALRIVGIKDPRINAQLAEYARDMAREVEEKRARLDKDWRSYFAT